MFVKLSEYWYHNGFYDTRPVCCNVNEISNVQEWDGGHGPDYCLITMKNGNQFNVKGKYDDIISEIVRAS